MFKFFKTHYWVVVLVILAIMFTAEITSAIQSSQIIDEAPHIAAGYSYVRLWDFHLNPEHPPLIKMMAGFPLLFMKLSPLSENPGWLSNNQWYAGQWLLYHNTVDHFWLLFWGRLPIMLLSIVLGLIIFKWAKELFGLGGGLLALLFYAFDPTTIAHARWITTDLGIALFMFATLYMFSRYLKRPTLKRLLLFAFILGLALVAKFSAVILIPLMLVYYLIARWQGWPRNVLPASTTGQKPKWPARFWPSLLMILVVVFFTVWATYGFEVKTTFSDPEVSVGFAPGKSTQQFDKLWLKFVNQITDTNTSLGHLTERLAKTVPVPAYTFAKGFAVLANHNYWGHSSYLLGQYSRVGWWYYFIIAFLVKTPLVTLLFTFVLLSLFVAWLVRHSRVVEGSTPPPAGWFRDFYHKLRRAPIDKYILILTPAAYFIWTLTSKLNLGVRHLLPVYPFIFVWIGSFATFKLSQRWRKPMITALIVLTAFYLASSVAIYPNYLSYFNEAVGGVKNGHKYLLDSNIDWGQGLIGLKKYMDKHDLNFIYFHYFGTAEPQAYGINHTSPPTNDEIKRLPDFEGAVAISVSGLYSESGEYSWLKSYTPIAIIDDSIWVYDIK